MADEGARSETQGASIPECFDGERWRSAVEDGAPQPAANRIVAALKRWFLRPVAEDWEIVSVQPFSDCDYFRKHQLYRVNARGSQLEAPILPSRRTWGLFAASNEGLLYLHNRRSSFEQLFRREARPLTEGNPRLLSNLFLECLRRRAGCSHEIVECADEVVAYDGQGAFKGGYQVRSRELDRVGGQIRPATLTEEHEDWLFECYALSGWMHEKETLLRVQYQMNKETYAVTTAESVVSRKIFRAVPSVRY